MASSIGLVVFSSSATFSKLGWRVALQSEGTTPAAVSMPPRMCVRKDGSTKLASVWPMPVYQLRPPS